MNINQQNSIPRLDWQYSKAWQICLFSIYVILAASPVILGFTLTPLKGEPALSILGRAAGLMGFAILALQVALSARFKFLDRSFGLDKLMRFHKWMAIAGGILLVFHPIFFALASESLRLFSMGTSWRVNLGKLALFLIILTVFYSMLLRKLRFQYQVWRFLHKGVILVVILGFLHGLFIGESLRSHGMKVYWWMLFVITCAIFLYRNLYMPLWGRKRFRVASVEQVSYDTFTLAFEPEGSATLPHHPGQFMFLKLQRPGRKSEQHPFTIASSPTGEMPLQATIKKSGDFTNTIGETVPGDKAFIEAPFGKFSFLHHNPKRFIFIAGGVGITPLMSMLKFLRDTGDKRQALLIFGNKAERDILFRNELDKMSDRLKIVNVLSSPAPEWTGARGFVTRELLEKSAGNMLADADVYLCGPPIMMTKVIAALTSLGVPEERIHYEFFAI